MAKKPVIRLIPMEEYDREYFSNPVNVRGFINACLYDYALTHDKEELMLGLSIVAKYMKPAQLAAKSGLTRQGVYKAVKPTSNPSFTTVLDILHAAGFGLKVTRAK